MVCGFLNRPGMGGRMVVKERVEMAVKSKRKIGPDENRMVTVHNNTGGKLVYTNRLGMTWEFYEPEDTNELSIRDLREMKSSQVRFFEQQWIRIAKEDEDVIALLRLEKYVERAITPEDVMVLLDGEVQAFVRVLEDAKPHVLSLIFDVARKRYAQGESMNAYMVQAIEQKCQVRLAP